MRPVRSNNVSPSICNGVSTAQRRGRGWAGADKGEVENVCALRLFFTRFYYTQGAATSLFNTDARPQPTFAEDDPSNPAWFALFFAELVALGDNHNVGLVCVYEIRFQ